MEKSLSTTFHTDSSLLVFTGAKWFHFYHVKDGEQREKQRGRGTEEDEDETVEEERGGGGGHPPRLVLPPAEPHPSRLLHRDAGVGPIQNLVLHWWRREGEDREFTEVQTRTRGLCQRLVPASQEET